MEDMSRISMAARSRALDIRDEDGRSHHAGRVRSRAPVHVAPSATAGRFDHFVERDGVRFAGMHLIIDLWQASCLDDIEVVRTALREAAEVAGATVLDIDLHCFTPNGGITGVAVLAQSHISVHTWPECGYAAIDVFMCGDAEPYKTIEVLRQAFRPRTVSISEHRRGVMP